MSNIREPVYGAEAQRLANELRNHPERTTMSNFQDRMHTESQHVYDRITAGEIQAADVEAALLLDAQVKASTDDDS